MAIANYWRFQNTWIDSLSEQNSQEGGKPKIRGGEYFPRPPERNPGSRWIQYCYHDTKLVAYPIRQNFDGGNIDKFDEFSAILPIQIIADVLSAGHHSS